MNSSRFIIIAMIIWPYSPIDQFLDTEAWTDFVHFYR